MARYELIIILITFSPIFFMFYKWLEFERKTKKWKQEEKEFWQKHKIK
jgi:hypothetical protein